MIISTPMRAGRFRLALALMGCASTAMVLPMTAAAQAASARFDIQSQPLATALAAFSQQSGIDIVGGVAIPDIRTTAVTGTMAPAEALSRLLAGSGISYRFTNAGDVVLERAPQAADGTVLLGPVRVTDSTPGAAREEASAWAPVEGYVARRTASATKTDTPLIEVPQIVNIVTADQLTATGAQSVGQALRYTPGVYAERTGSIIADDNLTIRGFTARTYVDGTRQPRGDLTTAQIDPFGLERVEILKGPSSVLYGRSAPGGIANLVRKRPTAEAQGEVELLAGSYSRFQGKIDISTPFDSEGVFSGRIVGLARDSRTQMDHIDDNRVFVAGSLAWRPSADTDLNLFASYQDDKTGAGSFFAEGTLLPNPNGPVPSDVYLGSSTDGYLREQWLLGYRLDHDFGNGIRIRSSADYTDTAASIQYPLVYGLGDDFRTATRYLGITPEDFQSLTLDNSVEFAFDTGAIGHRILVGYDFMTAKANRDDIPIYYGDETYVDVDIYNPDNSPGELGDRYTQLYFTQRQHGLYLQDQIAVDRLRITLGIRHDWAATQGWTSYFPTPEYRQRDSKLTGRAGAVYLFDNGFAPFVNFSTSFEPEPGATRAGLPFEPLTGRQFEAGLRFQPPSENLSITASVFDIEQRNVLAPDPTDWQFSVQIGRVRSRGVEIEAKASLAAGLDATAAFSHTDARVRESSETGTPVGNRLHFVPPTQASLWADYRFGGEDPVGVSLGGGVRYVSRQEGDAANNPDLRIPSSTIFDARIGFDLSQLFGWGEGLTAQINANNLFDRRYVTGCNSSFYAFCYLGQRRTLMGSIAYKW
ncbi:TonB-dependent siderophore receptor [Altererythrobacter xixiisoli]|uniref:TonB-dependent siderophore receptor n=1 Tax=Croceibacterium xixiisoli TaxID=1476466 RepID=A0A6I4TWC8_9SPHN|nr:TonB-dependent siderophore receptor [Croceibacterium xixiisoli]MXP00347.1 TonB-dependent siderophore receptor [Croceibacterium xixiisoli]